MTRVLAVFKAPAPYFSPLFKMFSQVPDIDLTVAYCVKTTEDGIHYTVAATRKNGSWSYNVLEGYKYFFLDDAIKPCGLPEHRVINTNIGKIIKEGNYDVILLNISYWSLTTWFLIRAAKKKHIPIITRATVEATRRRSKMLLALKELVVGRYCRKMAAGVYECGHQRDYLIHYGMPPESLFYAPCAVDNAYFRNLAQQNDKEKIREEFNIPKGKLILIKTGRISAEKRPWDLIRAYERVLKEGYDIGLYLVGDGPMKAEIETYCRDNNLQGVLFTGNVPQKEMGKFLSMADVFVLPAEVDASPKALNEAMNFELPIIVTDGVSTAPELLKDGCNGYIYKPGDIDSLVACIKKIADNPNRHLMGKESLKIVSENGYERVVSGWLAAINYSLSRH